MKYKILKFLMIKILVATYSFNALANLTQGEWKPQIVEKMYILPPKQLDRVLNNDFRSSSLFLNLKTTDDKIQGRYKKIDELNNMIPRYSGEELIELRHQVILEKKEYISDMNERLKIKRKHLLTKKRFFERLKKKAEYSKKVNNQRSYNKYYLNRKEALDRAKKLDHKVSGLIRKSNIGNASKYFVEYEKTMSAMAKLESKIKDHPKFKENDLVFNSKNKLEGINKFIYDLESELSVLDLKEQVLTKMAKLVSLDAMELADSLQNKLIKENQLRDVNDPNDSVDLFLN